LPSASRLLSCPPRRGTPHDATFCAWDDALLKLELFRPPGVGLGSGPRGPTETAELSGNQALSFARFRRPAGVAGAVTHEMRRVEESGSAHRRRAPSPGNPRYSARLVRAHAGGRAFSSSSGRPRRSSSAPPARARSARGARRAPAEMAAGPRSGAGRCREDLGLRVGRFSGGDRAGGHRARRLPRELEPPRSRAGLLANHAGAARRIRARGRGGVHRHRARRARVLAGVRHEDRRCLGAGGWAAPRRLGWSRRSSTCAW